MCVREKEGGSEGEKDSVRKRDVNRCCPCTKRGSVRGRKVEKIQKKAERKRQRHRETSVVREHIHCMCVSEKETEM